MSAGSWVVEQPEILLYTTPICGYCAAAKSLLQAKGASFREIDVSRDATARTEMVQRSGQRTVPQIFIGGRHIGGFEELAELEQDGKLDVLLGGRRE